MHLTSFPVLYASLLSTDKCTRTEDNNANNAKVNTDEISNFVCRHSIVESMANKRTYIKSKCLFRENRKAWLGRMGHSVASVHLAL
jgi:hypothetical protein